MRSGLTHSESLGVTYKGRQTGTPVKSNAFSFNGNKIITTSGGGMRVFDDEDEGVMPRVVSPNTLVNIIYFRQDGQHFAKRGGQFLGGQMHLPFIVSRELQNDI